MSGSVRPEPGDLAIPARLNVALALAAYAAAGGLLWLASHAGSLALALVAALAFSYVGNTIFSLLHESVHGIFHPRRAVNDGFGRVSAAFFPTGFTFQRVCHLGHHRRNRTDAELYDYVRPGQSRFLAWYRLYGLLLGFYWLAIPVGCLLYLAAGRLATAGPLRRVARPIGLEARLEDLERAPVTRARLEILLTVAIQGALAWGLSLTPAGWLLCYGAFALNWCALQYTDHAWTVRDIRNGASNLRVSRAVQWIFLNYHHHLAHHQHPRVPWLHRFVDFAAPRPGFLATYLSLWLGPRPTTAPAPGRIDPELERDLDRALLAVSREAAGVSVSPLVPVVLLVLGVLAAPRAAEAQPAAPAIGFLSSASADSARGQLPAFHRGLKDEGYAEGQNVVIEYRFADNQYDRLAALAAELVRRPVAVIVAAGGNVTAVAAKAATSTTPIVFTAVADPVKGGLVASLSRPGGNVTGIAALTIEILDHLRVVPVTVSLGLGGTVRGRLRSHVGHR